MCDGPQKRQLIFDDDPDHGSVPTQEFFGGFFDIHTEFGGKNCLHRFLLVFYDSNITHIGKVSLVNFLIYVSYYIHS